MARSMWSGVISFGLVAIPVKLHTATETHGMAFHQLHDKCESRIKERRWCPTCDEEVDWDNVVKGFEYKKGEYVVLTPEDFERLPLPSKDTIEVNSFVALEEIDPIYFDSTYYVDAGEKGAAKPYTLLHNVMESKKVVALATVTFRNKERICALRPMNGFISLHTLLYEDEVKENDAKKLSVSLTKVEKDMASSLVESMTDSFKPEKFKDNYQVALKKLVQAKLKGKEIEPAEIPASTHASDLMEMLQRSLDKNKGGRKKTASKRSSAKSASGKTTSRKSTRKKKAA